jgi:iron-sulfur cluster assembly protein
VQPRKNIIKDIEIRNNMSGIVLITDEAAEQIKRLIHNRNKDTIGIRIGVKKAGCSGLKYTFEYTDVKYEHDEEVTDKGVTIFIQPKALLHIVGTTLDYKETRVSAGFNFINPNEKGRCGCGESFYTN